MKHQSIRDFRVLQTKKSALQSELAKITSNLASTEVKCFRIFNMTSPIQKQFTDEEFDRETNEENALCQYLEPENNDPSNLIKAYQKKRRLIDSKLRNKQSQLDKLNEKLRLLDREPTNVRQITILGTFNNLRNQFDLLRDFYSNFKLEVHNQMQQMKNGTMMLIQNKKEKSLRNLNDSKNRVQELLRQRNQIKKQKENKIARLSLQLNVSEIQSEYDITEIREILEKYVNVIKSFQKKCDKIEYLVKPLDEKIKILEEQIEKVIEKANRYSNYQKEKRSGVVISNWGVLVYSLLKLSRYQNAITDFSNEMNETEKELTKKLTEETELAHQIVPGTNLTVLELRKLILKLTRELSEETQSKHDELTGIEKEHVEFSREMTMLITELEKKTNSFAGKAKK